jgi:hypothetical protein
MAALQDEFPDGKQEQEDKNGVEFGGEESVDHVHFSPSPAWFCGFHDRPEDLIRVFRIHPRVDEHTEPASV